jgi:glycosyltransferase involved in cell wall biosynthesis
MAGQAAGPERVLIAHLVNCLGIGGTERQLVEQLRLLDRDVFAADLSCLLKVGELLADVRALGLEPAEFNLRGTLLQPNTVWQIAKLGRRLREKRARLLQAHDFYSNVIGAAAARMAGIPCIVSRRDTGAWIDWKRERLLAGITRRAPFVLCNAYAIRDQLVHDEGVDPAKIAVVHNGLDVPGFDREASAMPAGTLPFESARGPVIAVVANMKLAVKGHVDVLRAASAVVRAVPGCRFLLVGDGALRSTLEREAANLGISHAVVFTGRRRDVPALLRRCQIAVSASHAEGLPNAVMEGMAARLPVVATAVGGTIELVRDGRTGFLVRRGDPVGLAQRILELVRDPALARRFGEAGRRRIEEEFSSARMGERMNALYGRVLGLRQELRRAA